MTKLEEAIISIAEFLESEKIPYMVIGGVANIIWGVPRSTIDVDVTIFVEEARISDCVNKLSASFTALPEDPIKFADETHVIPLKTNKDIRIDLILAQLPYEGEAIKRAKPVKIGKNEIKVCTPEDLIVHKIISKRTKDREDVKGIINKMKDQLDRNYLDPIVEELSRELAESDILGFYKNCFNE